MKAGLKRFKERGEEVVTKELSQLHFRDTFEPINPNDLNEEERLQVLESRLFLKEKRDTTVKGQMVAGGNKQRGTIDEQDASFPTAVLEQYNSQLSLTLKKDATWQSSTFPMHLSRPDSKTKKTKLLCAYMGNLTN
jgi:hypothetical protein